jgi:hypothetical protein
MSATDKRYEYKQTVAMINMKYIFWLYNYK